MKQSQKHKGEVGGEVRSHGLKSRRCITLQQHCKVIAFKFHETDVKLLALKDANNMRSIYSLILSTSGS